MSDSVQRGKPRKRDRTGDIVGPYVVSGPVGERWETTIYWRLACPLCGHTRTAHNESLSNVKALSKCGGCKQKVVAESLD